MLPATNERMGSHDQKSPTPRGRRSGLQAQPLASRVSASTACYSCVGPRRFRTEMNRIMDGLAAAVDRKGFLILFRTGKTARKTRPGTESGRTNVSNENEGSLRTVHHTST